MLSRPAAEVVASVAPDDFYRPNHANIADVIRHLVTTDKPTDAGSIAAELRQRGQLDAVGDGTTAGAAYLIQIMAGVPATTSAPNYAELIVGYARKRRSLGLLSDAVEAIYSNLPLAGLVAELSREAELEAEDAANGWDVVNLMDALGGDGGATEAALLRRTDGKALIYPGKTHAFNAESESGKSWLALAVCRERIEVGEHVVYIDFEADAADIVERLLALGLSPKQILDQFHYVRPDDPIDAGARLRMAALVKSVGATLCIIDGVAEALAVSGWEENEAGDITAFYGMLARPIARLGAAVILIDHLVKDKEKQGNDARGSGHKRAGITGAQYRIDGVKPFARGVDGMAKIIVTKDRHGWIRSFAHGGKVVGELHIISTYAGTVVKVEVRPSTSTDDAGGFRPTVLMERVSRALEASEVPVNRKWIEDNVKGKAAVVRTAIDKLAAEDYIAIERGGQTQTALLHRSIKPFRESGEPDQEAPEGEEDQYGNGDF